MKRKIDTQQSQVGCSILFKEVETAGIFSISMEANYRFGSVSQSQIADY
jgi:hypothetical protein